MEWLTMFLIFICCCCDILSLFPKQMTENNNVCGFWYFQVNLTNDVYVSETEMKRKLCQLNGELSDMKSVLIIMAKDIFQLITIIPYYTG